MKRNNTYGITLIILVGVFLLYGFTSKQNTDQKVETIIVKAIQVSVKNHSFIRVHYGNDKMEKIELEKLSMNEESMENNYNTIVTTINKLNADGYEVLSSSEFATSAGTTSNFVLEKRE